MRNAVADLPASVSSGDASPASEKTFDLAELKARLASPNRRKLLVYKFGGTTSGSTPETGRLRDARKLLESKLNEGYFVVPVFSALKREGKPGGRSKVAITDLLLDYRDIITGAPTTREGAREFRQRLVEPHLELMRDLDLIPRETDLEEARKVHFKAPHSILDAVQREVNAIVGDAITFCKFIPGPGAIDNFVSGGERLAVAIIAAYLNRQWKDSGFPWRAEPATALELGILTDGKFGDANILDQSLPLVYNSINNYKKRGVVPIVTGFDGIHKVEENGKVFRYRTTLGRSGSDLTATYIGYTMRAEATCLVKDTDGVLTANPRHVPRARTIERLSYDLAVEAGNIQSKAVKPCRDGRMELLVFNPKNPSAITRVGPEPAQPGVALLTDPTPCRHVRVALGEADQFFSLAGEMRRFNIRSLELYQRGDHVHFVQADAKSRTEFESELTNQRGWKLEAMPAWRVQAVGEIDRDTLLRFNGFIAQFKPLTGALWHEGAKAMTACFPQEGVEVSEILRAIHEEFVEKQ
jgi:aspartate kinase